MAAQPLPPVPQFTRAPTPTRAPLVRHARNYIFGHSLINHAPHPLTNVPRWVSELAQQAGYTYGMSGQYGFEDTHAANLPPTAQWGVPNVTSIWDDSTGQTFADVNFNTILFTAANFRQYYPPTAPEPGGFVPTSTVESTITVFDWVENEQPGGRYIIYENWPDMGPYTAADFTSTFPTPGELQSYYNYTRGGFHDWWLDYQDAMIAQRPNLEVRMVPVGPILANLLTTTLSDIPVSALYEDSAPHGKPTLYFLAGLITYMSIYGVEAPANYVVPNAIDARVRMRYAQISSEIWADLQSFVDSNGDSRVFPN